MSNITISTLSAASLPLDGTELMEMSQLSSSVTITTTTISALASDNSYNDSALGFGTAGFHVGDRVKVTGFTSHTVNNLLTGVITVLTNGKMTLGGTDGDVIVDESAGSSITITKWTTKRATAKDVGAGSDTSYVKKKSISSSSGTLTMDLSAGSTFETTLTENITTFTTTGVQSNTSYASFFTLKVKQDATGGRTFANPSSWKFPGGVGYVPSSAANAIDILQGISYDQGTTWLITYASTYS
jgi:hypothetical protein